MSFYKCCHLPYGLAVRIPGFHPGGPGSTPGVGIKILERVITRGSRIGVFRPIVIPLDFAKIFKGNKK